MMGWPRSRLLSMADRILDQDALDRLRAVARRRAAHEPVAYIVGEREFFSLSFLVTPDVLIPRPETEAIVEAALEWAAGRPVLVVDVGTGSGNIAVVLARWIAGARIVALDASAGALGVARRNAERHGVADRIEFLQGDILAPLGRGRMVDLVVCNPPYVSVVEEAGLEPGVRLHEPRIALIDTVDGDGMGFARRLLGEAPAHLNPGGAVILEMGRGQADGLRRIAAACGFTRVRIRKDLAGIERVLIAEAG